MQYKAVLLDIDGTLVDSNDAHARAWVQALAERGRQVEFTRVRPLIGMGGDKVLPALTCIDPESAEGKSIADRRHEIFAGDFLPHLLPTRGAQRLLERLRADGLTLVVATSAQASELRDLLAVAGANGLIDGASSSDDAKESKPDPDILQAALRKAGCRADEAVMIGDTPYDAEAARQAGVSMIALRCGRWWADEAFGDAIAVYDDPDDLLEHYALSPFKRRAPARSA